MAGVDRDTLGEAVKKARACAKQRKFDCAEEQLKRAEGFVTGAKDRRSIADAQEYLDGQKRAVEEEQRRAEEARAARAAAAARQVARDASGNMGGALDCNSVATDYGLWNYCKTGGCDGFNNSYATWVLCKDNDINGFNGNYAVWSYLKDGDVGGFAKNYSAWNAAKQNAGSFADRKRFIIYYVRGYIYGD